MVRESGWGGETTQEKKMLTTKKKKIPRTQLPPDEDNDNNDVNYNNEMNDERKNANLSLEQSVSFYT